MDQVKIGAYLKEMRKERNLTQEQLAEELNVSNRTVSRWETGNNMPDISLLIDIAEFYDVSIAEIIDTERRSKEMNEEVNEAGRKVAEYSEEKKARLLKKVIVSCTVGIFCQLVYIATNLFVDYKSNDVIGGFIQGLFGGLALGSMIMATLYITGALSKIKGNEKISHTVKAAAIIAIIICLAYVAYLMLRSGFAG